MTHPQRPAAALAAGWMDLAAALPAVAAAARIPAAAPLGKDCPA